MSARHVCKLSTSDKLQTGSRCTSQGHDGTRDLERSALRVHAVKHCYVKLFNENFHVRIATVISIYIRVVLIAFLLERKHS